MVHPRVFEIDIFLIYTLLDDYKVECFMVRVRVFHVSGEIADLNTIKNQKSFRTKMKQLLRSVENSRLLPAGSFRLTFMG